MITQLQPASLKAAQASFLNDKMNLSTRLLERDTTGSLQWYCNALNPYPVSVSENQYNEQRNLQACLSRVIPQLVSNFCSDKRLQDIVNLPKFLVEHFAKLSTEDYSIGSYRPDFLQSADGEIVICEINARFPSNAFFMTHYCNELMRDRRHAGQTSDQPRSVLSDDEHSIVDVLTAKFRPESPVTILKQEERGIDIHFLIAELRQRNVDVRIVTPADLSGMQDTKPNNESINMILELHQHELLAEKSFELLSELTTQATYYNDLRTIFLLHDKRMLSVFHQEDLLQDYCSPADISLLKKHVVPTYVAKNSPEILKEAIDNPEKWIIKPNLFGKGEGILFGRSTERNTWESALVQSAESDYVLQRYVPQRKFPILSDCTGELAVTEMNVVGTMLCFDNLFLGTGIYRASSDEIINVCRGGTILAPVIGTESSYPSRQH